MSGRRGMKMFRKILAYAFTRKWLSSFYQQVRFHLRLLETVRKVDDFDNPWITIGRHSYGIRHFTIQGATRKSPVTIGNFCSIGGDVVFLAHVGHPTALPSTYPFRTCLFPPSHAVAEGGLNQDAVTRGPIVVGHDVWIGHGATILSGVTIGTGAVIGAGAVVARDVPPYAVVVGNPARMVRSRFSPEQVASLLESAWWDLDDLVLASLQSAFYSTDIEAFVAAVGAARRTASNI